MGIDNTPEQQLSSNSNGSHNASISSSSNNNSNIISNKRSNGSFNNLKEMSNASYCCWDSEDTEDVVQNLVHNSLNLSRNDVSEVELILMFAHVDINSILLLVL